MIFLGYGTEVYHDRQTGKVKPVGLSYTMKLMKVPGKFITRKNLPMGAKMWATKSIRFFTIPTMDLMTKLIRLILKTRILPKYILIDTRRNQMETQLTKKVRS